MPRIFFDVIIDGNVTPDETGVELPDLKDVRWHAMKAATEIVREEISQRRKTQVSIEVSDDKGILLLVARASVKVEWVI